METVAKLEEEVAKLEQERLVYLNHMYQLAASARSVVEENRALRARLELIAASPATPLVRADPPGCLRASVMDAMQEHRCWSETTFRFKN